MALIHSLENSGNVLFRFRGQIPVVLFVLAIPVIYLTDTSFYTGFYQKIITMVAVSCSALGQLIRAYTIGTTPKGTSGRNTKEQVAEFLNSTGIYSTVRHPLYVGNYFMWIGIVIYTMNIWFVVCVSLAFWIYYERIMFAEERFLEKKFGDKYLNWSLGVPAFIPAFSKFVKSNVSFSLKTVLRREYSGVYATVIGFFFCDFLRDYFEHTDFERTTQTIYILIVATVITLVLRSLKHYTRVLHEEDRS